MEKELSLREIIYEIILFFIYSRRIILLTTIIGTLSIILFQKVRPVYYNTTAIVTSGLYCFERLNDESAFVLDQKVAIDLVNLLNLDVQKEDFHILSKKMKISLEDASTIKSIKAEAITMKDVERKELNTSKFSIDLSVRNNQSISNIQQGIIDYFSNNNYIKGYYDQFISTTINEINEIDNEVTSLRGMRESESDVDVSSVHVSSIKSEYDINNQIMELIRLRSKNSTDLVSLKPLAFVAPFTETQSPERGVLVIGSVAAGISFLLGIIISVFRAVYLRSKE